MWSAPIGVDDAVGREHREDLRLDAGEAQRDAVGLRELRGARASFAAPWESMKLTPSRSSTSACERPAVLGQPADAVLERLGGGEEEAAVEAQDGDARERLVVGVLVEVAEHLRCPARGRAAASAAASRRRRATAARARRRSRRRRARPPRARRRSRPPRSRSRSASTRSQAAQLADVDHPEHDRVDDHGAEHGLRQVGEQRREDDQRRQHERRRSSARRPACAPRRTR